MGWRGKYRDSLGSKCGLRKKETPKVSGNDPCSLNIRSNPPPSPLPYVWSYGGVAGLMKTTLFEVWWEGCFSPRGRGRVVFGLPICLGVMLVG